MALKQPLCYTGGMKKKVIVLLAKGFEEVEAITPIDYLRRSGIEVCVAAVFPDALYVKSARGVEIKADAILSELARDGKLSAAAWDGVVVPGGLPGADNLAASEATGAFLKEMAAGDKLICAICAAPARVLSPLGLLAGKNFTCYPGEEVKVLASGSASPGAVWKEDRVVEDGNLITSRGAGTAGEFSCRIVAKLAGEAAAKELAERVLLHLP